MTLSPNEEFADDPQVKQMVFKKTWKEFQDAKLLWWVNRLLHTFGWCLVYEQLPDGTVMNVYPAKTKYRGFPIAVETEGFKGIAKLIREESDDDQ